MYNMSLQRKNRSSLHKLLYNGRSTAEDCTKMLNNGRRTGVTCTKMLYTIEEIEQPAEKCLTKTVSRDFSTPLFHQSSVDLSFFITKILQLLAMELTYGINLNSSIHCDHRQQHKTFFSPACAMRPPKVHFLWRPNIPCLAVPPHCWEPTIQYIVIFLPVIFF